MTARPQILVTIYYLTNATLWQWTMRWQCKLCQLFGVIGREMYMYSSHMGVSGNGGLFMTRDADSDSVSDASCWTAHAQTQFVSQQLNNEEFGADVSCSFVEMVSESASNIDQTTSAFPFASIQFFLLCLGLAHCLFLQVACLFHTLAVASYLFKGCLLCNFLCAGLWTWYYYNIRERVRWIRLGDLVHYCQVLQNVSFCFNNYINSFMHASLYTVHGLGRYCGTPKRNELVAFSFDLEVEPLLTPSQAHTPWKLAVLTFLPTFRYESKSFSGILLPSPDPLYNSKHLL